VRSHQVVHRFFELPLCQFLLLPLYPQNSWRTSFGLSGYDEGFEVIPVSDGGCYVVGRGAPIGHGVVKRLAANGAEMWTIMVASGSGALLGGTLTQDGGLLAVGRNADPVYTNAFICKFSALGVLEWSTSLGGVWSDIAFTCYQLEDLSYVVAGRYSEYNKDERLFIIKLGIEGDLIWGYFYGGFGLTVPTFVHATRILETKQGELVVLGYGEPTGSNGHSNVFLLKVDSAGGPLWMRSYGNEAFDDGMDMVITQDNGFAVCGWSHSGSSDSGFLLRMDANGYLEWVRRYDTASREGFFSLTGLDDGGFTILGTTSTTSSDRNILMIRCDSVGNVLWSRRRSELSIDHGHSLRRAADNGYFISGYWEVGDYNWDATVLRTEEIPDECGWYDWPVILTPYYYNTVLQIPIVGVFNIVQISEPVLASGVPTNSFCPIPTTLPNSDAADLFTVVPNPTSNRFKIQCEFEEILTVRLLDLRGRLILERTGLLANLEFDLSNEPSMIYLLTIDTEKWQRTLKVVLCNE
ncbi:MAG: T9SS type A sorting domain-containing protein, partial [Bacteroidota bacterium]|nr:T9SS type A sorting domain-containing protein [Bacteroidota bacterium]